MAYVRVAGSDPPGVHTFYVESLTAAACDGIAITTIEYTIKHIRTGRGGRYWSCTCPTFIHRAQVSGHHCKHIKLVRWWAKLVGGLRKIPRGQRVDIDPTPALSSLKVSANTCRS